MAEGRRRKDDFSFSHQPSAISPWEEEGRRRKAERQPLPSTLSPQPSAAGGRRRKAEVRDFLQPSAVSLQPNFISSYPEFMSNLNSCTMSHFEELKVWQKSVDLAVKTYEISRKEPFKKDFGLRDQMRRSSVSISSNISEGDQLDSDKSSIRHFRIAKGLTAELYTQIIICSRIGYLDSGDSDFFKKECQEILGMLSNLIKHRSGR